METVKCKAELVFTHFVPRHGQVHGNPKAKDAANPMVPVSVIPQLVAEGKISAPKGWDKEPDAAESEVVEPDEFVTGGEGGWFAVKSPWMDEPEKVQGLEKANERAAEIRESGDPQDQAPS